MASSVYLWSDVSRLRDGASECFKIIRDVLCPGMVGFKVHFGEEGNKTHVKPEWLRDAKTIFDRPVFVECNVMYRGSRTRKADHVATAKRHGFGFIDIDILDGEMGEASMEVPVNVGRTKAAKLGAGLEKYDRLVSVSHFKGHMATGFGGVLKNIGMGLGSRGGKMDMHSIISPIVNGAKCVACGTCVADCPVGAITLGDVAAIDSGKCVGCAHCIAVCPRGALDIPWNMSNEVNNVLMEKIAEYALAAVRGRRWWHMNFITDLTYDCDCMGTDQKPFMKDIGIVLSDDPVACDQAAFDLVKERSNGKDPFLKKHEIDGTHILEYAEKIGLGKRAYALKPVSRS
ncbi:MAG: DUF362 domain-containing protein [Candidatus Altiarchaeota archaeon]